MLPNLTLVIQGIAFFAVAWLVMKFGWPHIMSAIEERQRKIAEGLAAADNSQKALAQAQEQVNAINAANPTSAYAPLSSTAGTPTNLLTYNGPTAGADNVTIGFRQAITANEVLRSGNYSKTLTFTLSTTQP